MNLFSYPGSMIFIFCRNLEGQVHRVLQNTGVAEKYKPSLDKGIPGNETDLMNRKNLLGQIHILGRRKECLVAAAAPLALGINTEGVKEGWYDGGSIVIAVLVVIVFTAASDYKQSLQFQNSNEEIWCLERSLFLPGENASLSIQRTSIVELQWMFELIALLPSHVYRYLQMDLRYLVIPFRLMNQVTGKIKIDPTQTPFLMSGRTVADGCGTMLIFISV
ncbi:plasma membrane calcium-transporting ATPase [Striga asiatica]|uniref:Plasma membrane calcium-transporting ATPase n=1 Tax=Striga asiatica TaxID=4170 RepID=A0A5A7RKU5_STRAF|nr:plasma membrane calcium-transporting ATPase [Striga asiatica]